MNGPYPQEMESRQGDSTNAWKIPKTVSIQKCFITRESGSRRRACAWDGLPSCLNSCDSSCILLSLPAELASAPAHSLAPPVRALHSSSLTD